MKGTSQEGKIVEKDKKDGRKYEKKTFEIVNQLGKLLIEVNVFAKYFFVIVTYAGLLKVDGTLQLAFPTPYNSQPTVIDLQSDNQASSDEIAKKLSKELQTAVVLSLNIEMDMNKKGQLQLLSALMQILKSI